MKFRMFSVPYNGENPDEYLAMLDKHKEHIDDIFLGYPLLLQNHLDNKENPLYSILNTQKLLDICPYKTLVALNSTAYSLSANDRELLTEYTLPNFIERYNPSGFILTDFQTACAIHKKYPQLELHTSCNCFQWTEAVMNEWKRRAGINVFNPPREFVRIPRLLKKFHNEGYKLKVLINEGCLFGCPERIGHCVTNGLGDCFTEHQCSIDIVENVFRGVYATPKSLEMIDEYIDIYKLAGRLTTTKRIDKMLTAYENNSDNVYLKDIVEQGTAYRLSNVCNFIKASNIPKEVFSCECKYCDQCMICTDAISKLTRAFKSSIGKRDVENS